ILSRTGGNHGIGFAIPSEMVKKISKALIEDGVIERGYLGVSIQDISGDLQEVYKNQKGAVVIAIEKDSPADKSGLKVWDLIVKVNNKEIKGAADLKNMIGTFNPKDKVTLTILRDKKEQTLSLALSKAPNEMQGSIKENSGIAGLEIGALNAETKSKFGIPNNVQGVLVTNVKANSKAEELGFNSGDIIIQIESFSISDIKSFSNAMERYKGQTKRMLINRNGRIFSIVAK
ncbi:PDZ domain-containing protein, partial [Helicobacter rodentium]